MLAKMLLAYSFIHSFIHSGYFYSVSSSPILLRSAPCELATVNEGLVQGNYVAARAGVEPMTLRRLNQCATTPRGVHPMRDLE